MSRMSALAQAGQTAVKVGNKNLKQLLGHDQLVRIDKTLDILMNIENIEQSVDCHDSGQYIAGMGYDCAPD